MSQYICRYIAPSRLSKAHPLLSLVRSCECFGGIELDPSSVTVNEYLQRWLNDSVWGSVKPMTFESYERLVQGHIVPALGQVKVKSLSPLTFKRSTGTAWMPGSRLPRFDTYTLCCTDP
jgi:hypothetical protein